MTEFDQKALLSTKEAGELFTYHPDYVGRLCRTGKVQGIQVGGSWMVNRKSLEDFVRAQGRVLEEVALESVLVPKKRSDMLAQAGASVGVFAVILLSFFNLFTSGHFTYSRLTGGCFSCRIFAISLVAT